MTQREQYQAALDKLAESEVSVTELGDLIDTAEPTNLLGDELNDIFDQFSAIRSYIEAQVGQIDQDSVVNSFLAELKVVFEKYEATIETGNASGYGEAYGEGSITGIKFTATSAEGVVGSKVVDKNVIRAEDL